MYFDNKTVRGEAVSVGDNILLMTGKQAREAGVSTDNHSIEILDSLGGCIYKVVSQEASGRFALEGIRLYRFPAKMFLQKCENFEIEGEISQEAFMRFIGASE